MLAIRISKFFKDHPLLKGMAVYSIVWPASATFQNLVIRRNDVDWKKNLRFCVFGSLFIAPMLYGWIKLSSAMWPRMNLRSGCTKAIVEQFCYSPLAGVSFFYLMSMMEGKSKERCVQEVKDKFPQTYLAGVCYWPIIQTINFSFIAERNRVPFVSVCSFCWTIFLAYMDEMKVIENTPVIKTE